ncbi:MAG: 4-hydroxybenzoate octaprenyltransferase [Gammaproteobacteria bacterium]
MKILLPPRTNRRWPRLRARVRDRMGRYALLMRLHRPIGWLLLLWPALWALWLAGDGSPRPLLVAVFCVGVVVMRSAGCVINDFADRDFDAHVERTRDRPLATGSVSAREALGVAAALLALAAALLLLLNPLACKLAVAGVFWAALYPFTKRFTYFPQVFLGLAFGWGIPMAFAAQAGNVPPLAWLVFATNMVWVLIYDTLYAMVDREDDLRIGIKSTAILFDDADRPIIGALQVLFVFALILIGTQAHRGAWYGAGVAIAAGLFCWQQYLIRDRARDACFAAFRNNQWVGAAVFAGLALDYGLSG